LTYVQNFTYLFMHRGHGLYSLYDLRIFPEKDNGHSTWNQKVMLSLSKGKVAFTVISQVLWLVDTAEVVSDESWVRSLAYILFIHNLSFATVLLDIRHASNKVQMDLIDVPIRTIFR
jgi:hypothetical protein